MLIKIRSHFIIHYSYLLQNDNLTCNDQILIILLSVNQDEDFFFIIFLFETELFSLRWSSSPIDRYTERIGK